MPAVVLVLAALVLSATVPLGLRRRVLCPLSTCVGLLAGLAWCAVVIAWP